MSWIVQFFNSSIGNKLLMSLTGLFLCSFLLVHCAGNCLLFANDNGVLFNHYAEFMSKNPVIKFVAYGLYFAILLHALKGIAIWLHNRSSRGGQSYSPANSKGTWYSKNMALLGSWIFVFIGLHMYHFWWKVQMGTVLHTPDGMEDLFTEVKTAFEIPWIAVFYVVSCAMLAFHLLHGFQSAFQTLGLTHRKYTPTIKALGWIFSVVVPVLFASMPLYFLLQK
jgi:succinate dehydrogenase / fumarate reductase cytochrome b subunit